VYTIALGPASVLLGVVFGVAWGNLTRFVPKENDVWFDVYILRDLANFLLQ
jgi:hypothetical protein